MEDKERTQRDAHFQEELEFLKTSMARLISLLEQTLRNTFDEDPSNRSILKVISERDFNFSPTTQRTLSPNEDLVSSQQNSLQLLSIYTADSNSIQYIAVFNRNPWIIPCHVDSRVLLHGLHQD